MRVASSAEQPNVTIDDLPHEATALRALDLSVRTRAAMVVLGFIPAVHVLATAAPLVLAVADAIPMWAAWLSPVVLFVVPPLLVRVTSSHFPKPGQVDLNSRAFLAWWFTAQCQVVFARLPMLEEIIRLIPGLYSCWLRLWGARIGSLVYWSPGVVILDRSLVNIGSRVVFGVGVRFNPHVLAPDAHGRAVLYVAPVSVGNDVLVGGYSLLLPGCAIADGEVTPPQRSVHAFSRYEKRRRTRLQPRATSGQVR